MELPILRPLFTPPPLTAHILAARCVSTPHGSVHTHSFVQLRIPCSRIPNFIAVSLSSFLSSRTILHSHSLTSTPSLPFKINLSACFCSLLVFLIFPDNVSIFSFSSFNFYSLLPLLSFKLFDSYFFPSVFRCCVSYFFTYFSLFHYIPLMFFLTYVHYFVIKLP